MRELARLRIAELAPGGDGVGHFERGGERRAVFVPRTAPGDLVDASVDFGPRPARGTLRSVVEPSPSRVAPVCPWLGRCGGCDWMHLSVEAQSAAHALLVRRSLERAGAGELRIATHQAARALGYRARARLAVQADRGGVRLGYRRGASHSVVDVDACAVLEKTLEAALAPTRALFRDERGRGEVSLSLGALGRPVLDVSWQDAPSGALFLAIDRRVEDGTFGGAVVRQPGASRPAAVGDARAETQGADGRTLTVPAGAFAQAHPAMSAKVAERALALAPPDAERVLELFAGSGNFTVVLAPRARHLTAVESSSDAAHAAQGNLTARGLVAQVVVADADAFPIGPGERIAWLDPPRQGAPGAMRALAGSHVRRVAYVSCDPITLGRDVHVLVEAGMRVAAVETFEMFPQTSHVETLVVLDRRRA
jgi:23S rRNA (uracil1939-C5)-methyltransferase